VVAKSDGRIVSVNLLVTEGTGVSSKTHGAAGGRWTVMCDVYVIDRT